MHQPVEGQSLRELYEFREWVQKLTRAGFVVTSEPWEHVVYPPDPLAAKRPPRRL